MFTFFLPWLVTLLKDGQSDLAALVFFQSYSFTQPIRTAVKVEDRYTVHCHWVLKYCTALILTQPRFGDLNILL